VSAENRARVKPPNRAFPLRSFYLGTGGIIAASVIAIYWPTVNLPYVYDDWLFLHSIRFHEWWEYLLQALNPSGKILYRPAGALFFLVAYHLFHLDSTGVHVILLVLHMCTSLLIVSILLEMTGDRLFSAAVGVLYAVAATIHLDPLMWMAGFYDVGSAFFFFLAFFLFIKRRSMLSAGVYLLGMTTKESAFVLGGILFLYLYAFGAYGTTAQGERISLTAIVSRLRYHIATLFGYILVKSIGLSPFALPDTHSYRVRIWGDHIWGNLYQYTAWMMDTIVPLRSLALSSRSLPLVIIASLMALLLGVGIIFLLGAEDKKFRGDRVRKAAFWCCWLVLGLLPVILLPEHTARYFLTSSLVPAIALSLGAVKVAASVARSPRAILVSIVILYTVVSVFGSLRYVLEVSQGKREEIDGSYLLVSRGKIVATVRSYLERMYPDPPSHTNFIIDWIDTRVLYYSAGPQVWYGDTTVTLYESRDVTTRGGMIVPVSICDYHGRRPITASPEETPPLDPRKTILLIYHDGVIGEQELSTLIPHPPDTQSK